MTIEMCNVIDNKKKPYSRTGRLLKKQDSEDVNWEKEITMHHTVINVQSGSILLTLK